MNIQRHGIILNCEHFDACVHFYRTLFGLPVMFEKQEGDFRLCCLAFGESYLMLETEGHAKPEGKNIAESPHKLRFNVSDIEAALADVRAFGIEADITVTDWGSVINICDPDGNRIGIRDEASFAL